MLIFTVSLTSCGGSWNEIPADMGLACIAIFEVILVSNRISDDYFKSLVKVHGDVLGYPLGVCNWEKVKTHWSKGLKKQTEGKQHS